VPHDVLMLTLRGAAEFKGPAVRAVVCHTLQLRAPTAPLTVTSSHHSCPKSEEAGRRGCCDGWKAC